MSKIKHGHSTRKGNSPTYNSWNMMKKRCNNPKATGYEYYGGRGIHVCERWNKFENFLEDMGIRPEGTTLDRIDPDKDYSPENCRWADKQTQMNNQRCRNEKVLF